MAVKFRVEIPLLRHISRADQQAIQGALLDAARSWLEGHTLRRSLYAGGIEVTIERDEDPIVLAPPAKAQKRGA